MKPRILYQELKFDFPRTFVDPSQSFPEPGSALLPLYTDPKEWGFPLLISIAHANQYKPLPHGFSPSHFLRIGGSVNCHDDSCEWHGWIAHGPCVLAAISVEEAS